MKENSGKKNNITNPTHNTLDNNLWFINFMLTAGKLYQRLQKIK